MNAQLYRVLVTMGIIAVTALASASANGEEPTASNAEIKAAIEKSLPYIEEKGRWWMEKKDCMSCHRTAFMAWSHAEASYAGLSIDREKVNSWIDWCNDDLFKLVAEKDRKYDGELSISRNLSGGAQMLALSKHWQSTDSQKAKQKKIVDMLLKGQQKDGSWTPSGQLPLQKRELGETTQVITIWNALALHNVSKQLHIDSVFVEKSISSAAKFASTYDGGKSSEWMAIRALLAHELQEVENSKSYRILVFDAQNEDGGWGWITGEQSDVLATAQVLYAMLEMKLPSNDPRLRSAIHFILTKQQENGLWKVNGTKTKAKSRATETANYWGTCWAAVALSKSLSSSKKQK